MPRGNNSDRGGGANRGGRYKPRGRGGGGGRGRGRGSRDHSSLADSLLDFPVQMWPNNHEIGRQGQGYRGRGRGGVFYQPQVGSGSSRGGTDTPPRGRGRGRADFNDSPRGRGRGEFMDFPRGRVRGNISDSPRGRRRRGPKLRSDAPLSRQLDAERPFLKPVVFVRSVYTRTLFENEEDLLKPQIEEVGNDEKSHAPTADKVSRVFSGATNPPLNDSDSDDDAEEIEEIDFDDMAKLREEVDAMEVVEITTQEVEAEETFTGIKTMKTTAVTEQTSFYIDTTPLQEGFIVDTSRSTIHGTTTTIENGGSQAILGEDDDDEEEIIVYVAPHPRVATARESTPSIENVISLPTTSILTGTTTTRLNTASIPTPPAFDTISFSFANLPIPKKTQPRTRPVMTARDRVKAKAKARKVEARAMRRRLERRAMFGSFGAIMSEAQLRGDGKDPRWEERRRGDSDVDWGDSDEEERQNPGGVFADALDDVSNGVGAMELDPDIDMDAMKSFVKGMNANGGRHVTMDDLADEERMRQEDAEVTQQRGEESGEESDEGSSATEGEDDDEIEMIQAEEVMLIGEGADNIPEDGDDYEDNDSSEDVDASPNTVFRARLGRLRKQAGGRKVVDAERSSDSDDSDDDYFDGPTRAEEDEEFLAKLDAIMDEKNGGISRAERKARNKMFLALYNGDLSDVADELGLNKGKKDKVIPPHLQEQWDKDRAKKAEFKRARAQARLEAAADPFTDKKGGKKGRKAMLAASKFDPTIVIPDRMISMVTIENQIRTFISNLGGKQAMTLPPMAKESRKQVHELAIAFNLKSVSKGKGDGRYTTLTKTTRSGVAVNERKVRQVLKRTDGGYIQAPWIAGKGKGNTQIPRHKDGDEVGKAAPKIGETNIGFKMLASMGWAEGDRIGFAGGIDAPLTAVIKNTKLGLGANR